MVTVPDSRPCVLRVGRLQADLEQALDERCAVISLEAAAVQSERLPLDSATAQRVTAVVTSAPVGLPAAWLPSLPNLVVVSSFGVGTDRLPLLACRERGVTVGYTPDVLNDCVADLAMAGLLCAARQVCVADAFVRQGKWLQGRFPLTTQVSGKRLGIVGLGRIGRAIARRAAGFDMTVAYFGRRPVPDVPWRFEPSLHALARDSDFLIVSTAGGPETRHLINREVLQALGPRGLVVNVARGSVIDEQALMSCLASGDLGGAALDVFEHEPQVPDALLAMPQVVLMPHMASGTHETRQRMADLVLRNLDAGLQRLPLPAAVA